MKRTFLLTLAFCMLSTLSFAQSGTVLERIAPMTKSSLKELVKPQLSTTLGVRPHRSVADGVYYTHEKGVMYVGMTADGSGYRGTFLNYPPFQEAIFLNKTGSLDINWSINGNDYTEDMDPKTGDFSYGSMPKTTATAEGLRSYYAPTLTMGKSSYTYLDIDYRGEANEDGSSIVVTNTPGWNLSYNFSDYNTNILYGGGWVDAKTGDDTYIFGSGSITFNDIGTCSSIAVSQVFPAPIAPFTANSISIRTMSATTPIAAGKKLYMEIRNVETMSDGSLTFGDEIYETLEATADDVELAWTYSDGDNVYNVYFNKKEVDDFGIEANAPFVLDKDFCVVIGGLSDEGIDCGFMGLTVVTEDLDYLPSAEPLIETKEGQIYTFNYGIPMTLPCDFWGFFDGVEVPTVLYGSDDTTFEDCNILRVSADGQTVTNDNYPEVFDSYVYISVARDWEDMDGNENYYFDAPEWVSDITIYEIEGSEDSGMYLVTIQAEPLPEGTTGRRGEMYLKGIGGLTSENPIIVLQGDATNDKPWAPVVDAEGYTELVHNGDCEGSDGVSLVCKNAADGGSMGFNQVAGAGVNGSKAVCVTSAVGATNDWDSQFFIYAPDYVFQYGDEYKVSFMARADVATNLPGPQAHTTPGNYIGWYVDGSAETALTNDWKEISFSGTVNDSMEQYGGIMNGMSTLAYNLNVDKEQVINFYFDNISWKVRKDLTGIKEVNNQNVVNSQRYNLNGMRVNANYKGIVIENGKKFIQK